MPTVEEIFTDNVQIVDLNAGYIPPVGLKFELVHTIAPDPSIADAQESLRYIVALRGRGREAARHRLRDRVLDFKSGRGNSLFAFEIDKAGAAALVLDLRKKPIAGHPHQKSDYTQGDKVKIAKFVQLLDDCNVVVIRGTFRSHEAFIMALGRALEHDHTVDPLHLTSTATRDDLIHLSSLVATQVGRGLDRVLPNIPGARGLSGAFIHAGKVLGRHTSLGNEPTKEPPAR